MFVDTPMPVAQTLINRPANTLGTAGGSLLIAVPVQIIGGNTAQLAPKQTNQNMDDIVTVYNQVKR